MILSGAKIRVYLFVSKAVRYIIDSTVSNFGWIIFINNPCPGNDNCDYIGGVILLYIIFPFQ